MCTINDWNRNYPVMRDEVFNKISDDLIDNKIYHFAIHKAHTRSKGRTVQFRTDEIAYFNHYMLGNVNPCPGGGADGGIVDYTMKKYL